MRKGKFLNKISYLALVVLETSNLTGCSIVRYEEIMDGVGVEEISLKKEYTGRTPDKRPKVLIDLDTTATYDDLRFDLQYRPIEKVEISSKVERSSVSPFHISNPWRAIIIHASLISLFILMFKLKKFFGIRLLIRLLIGVVIVIDPVVFLVVNYDVKYTEELPPRISEDWGEPRPIPDCQISISLPQFQHPELKYKTDSDGILDIKAKDISDRIHNLNPVLDITHIEVHTSVDVDGKTYQDIFCMRESSGLFQVFKAAQAFSELDNIPHVVGVLSVSFDANGKYLASGSEDGTIHICQRDDSGWKLIYPPLSASNLGVLSVSFDADGKYLASGSEDGTIRIWQRNGRKFTPVQLEFTGEGGDLVQFYARHIDLVSVSFDADGKYLASGSEDGTIHIWQRNDREVTQFTHIRTLPEPKAGVLSVSFSADGKYLASGSEDGTIHIWQRNDREVTSSGSRTWEESKERITKQNWTIIYTDTEFTHIQLPLKLEAGVLSVSFDANGKYLASGSKDGTILVWQRYDSGWIPFPFLSASKAGVLSVSFSANGKYLASGSKDGTHIWQRNDREVTQFTQFTHIRTLQELEAGVLSVSFGANGKYLASGSEDKKVKIYGKDI